MTRSASSGSMRFTVRPSASTIRPVRCGSIRIPPFATVATTVAICSGVTRRRSWPIATRPMSTRPESTAIGFCCLTSKTPLGVSWASG